MKQLQPTEGRAELRDVSAELLAMRDADQLMRKSGVWDETIDPKSTARLKDIIAAIGWPTKSKVGADASTAAWLLAQHADLDPTFQAQCLGLMQEARMGEVEPQHVALLEDRVRVNQGLPQLYGTQGRLNQDGLWEPLTIEDQVRVDARRASVGLEPLGSYIASMRQRS